MISNKLNGVGWPLIVLADWFILTSLVKTVVSMVYIVSRDSCCAV